MSSGSSKSQKKKYQTGGNSDPPKKSGRIVRRVVEEIIESEESDGPENVPETTKVIKYVSKNDVKSVVKASTAVRQVVMEDAGTSSSNEDSDHFSSCDEALDAPFKGLRIDEDRFINILLIGETGVGKSTFINSIANYFKFSTFEEALEREDLLVVIPSQINIIDRHGDEFQMHLGSDKNEFLEVGASATQNVKTYVFPIGPGRTRLRLIDSPGMGDTRGVTKDDENCDNILNYIAQLEELHAICFLMRPTNTRITVLFEYCVKQILSRLEKSASENIIFIFTNTRGADYTGGETLPCLKRVVNKIQSKPPHVTIPTKDNIFCLDNEAFRTLAALKNSFEIADHVVQKNFESWGHSSKECWRMIAYIVGDATRPPLKPHLMSNSVSVNEARRMIVHLSKPLADVAQLISDNLAALERHQANLNMDNQSLDDLKNKLYVPVINLKLKELDQPVTVCTKLECAEIYTVRNIQKWHYRQRCHAPCYLNNVTKEIVGDPALRNCAAMDRSGKCKECQFQCDFSIHMHIYYETETFDDTVTDEVVKGNIQTKEKALEEAKKIVHEIEKKRVELESEHNVIVKSTAQFAHFLQNNAISPFNDTYKEYIEYLIVREKSLGKGANTLHINNLERMKKQYEEEKAVFDRSLSMGSHVGVSSANVQSIFSAINQLFGLKHNGEKIKEIYEKQKKLRKNEYYQNCEYVHPQSTSVPSYKKSKFHQVKDAAWSTLAKWRK